MPGMGEVKMEDVNELARERTRILQDVLDGRIPKRVPVAASFSVEFCIQYCGKDLVEVQWKTDLVEEVFDKVCADFYADMLPVNAFRIPSFYRILGAKNFVMSSGGFLQHPEVEGMAVDDYDYFISSPYDCIVERILPRIYGELNTDSPKRSIVFAKAMKAFYDEMGSLGMVYGKLIQKYGYANVSLFGGFTEAPFDFLADQLRGFKNITVDVRRIPEKVEAAVEAVLPLMLKAGTPPVIDKYSATFIPLHMAPYLRNRDFERFYWPTFKKLVDALAERGLASYLFVEQDWMRFLDYLYELPENTIMRFEYGDPKLVKEKLGKKHILSGFYPLTLLKTGTRQQCIDKAKEIIDILAPGGKFIFDFDKAPITVDSINVDNARAVLDYVAANADY